MSVYQLYTTGHHGDEIFCGTFSTLNNALNQVDKMMLHLRKTWIELDFIDEPVGEQNIIWETNESFSTRMQKDLDA
jgi:hypothetical protein